MSKKTKKNKANKHDCIEHKLFLAKQLLLLHQYLSISLIALLFHCKRIHTVISYRRVVSRPHTGCKVTPLARLSYFRTYRIYFVVITLPPLCVGP